MVKELHVVLGGGGYPGLHLAQALQQQNHHVRLFDIAEPPDGTPEGMDFLKVSLTFLTYGSGGSRGWRRDDLACPITQFHCLCSGSQKQKKFDYTLLSLIDEPVRLLNGGRFCRQVCLLWSG